jgi:hypothetical protein
MGAIWGRPSELEGNTTSQFFKIGSGEEISAMQDLKQRIASKENIFHCAR